MLISDHLSPSRVVLGDYSRKENLIATLVGRLETDGMIADAVSACERVLEREQEMSTGIGGGLAMPHARIEGVPTLAAAMAVVPDGVPFDALDGTPVFVVVLFVSPLSDSTAHSRFLAAVSALFSSSAVVDELRSSATATQAYEVLKRLESGAKSTEPS